MLCRDYTHVIQIGYGKSGTTTVRDYFEKLGYNSSCFSKNDVDKSFSNKDWPLSETLKKCKHMYVSELSHIYFPKDNYHLQLTHMNSIRTNMPSNTLYVHCQRNSIKWVRSVRHWNNLFYRFTTRDIDGLPKGYPRDDKDLKKWYESINAYLKTVFAYRPNYIKVDVESHESLSNLTVFCNHTHEWTAKNVNKRLKWNKRQT